MKQQRLHFALQPTPDDNRYARFAFFHLANYQPPLPWYKTDAMA